MADRVISEYISDEDGLLSCKACHPSNGCVHIREAIALGQDRGTFDEYESGDVIVTPVFTMPLHPDDPEESLSVTFTVLHRDDAGVLVLEAASAGRGPTIRASLMPSDGRASLRDEVIQWAIANARANWRACMTDYHVGERRVLEDRLENIGVTNKLYLLETVCLWRFDRCTKCVGQTDAGLVPTL